LLVLEVADELAVEMEETDAEVDAWLGRASASSTSMESMKVRLLLNKLASN
jgi:hypothetical protein